MREKNVKKIEPIERAFEKYLKKCYPLMSLHPYQFEELRQAFFAGVSLFLSLRELSKSMPDKKADRMFAMAKVEVLAITSKREERLKQKLNQGKPIDN